MKHKAYHCVQHSVRKKDAMQLLTGKPVYTDDIAPKDALIVKLLRSPHANAMVRKIDTEKAKKVPGIVDIYTWEDVPKNRYSNAGQTFPHSFLNHFFRCIVEHLPAHFVESRVEAVKEVFGLGHGQTGAKVGHGLTKLGIVDRTGGIHGGIIVIQNQAGIF